MLVKKRQMGLGIAASVMLIIMAGCFNNPVDPLTSTSGTGGISVNTSDNNTTGITTSYSQANNQGVYISVRDQDGNALTASYFNSSNFQVIYNGTVISAGSIQVSTASGSGQSISTALVLDYSGSMGAQDISDMENAAITFVNNMQAADRGEIIKFGSYVYREQAYTADKGLLSTTITAPTSASGSTALCDAIYMGLTDTAQESGQRAVVAFTDGYENNSYHTMNDIIYFSHDAGIPIYTIGLGNADSYSLLSVANQTNGLYYSAPTSAELATIYSRIAQIFTNTLIISWPSFVYNSGDTIIITVTYSCKTGTYTSTINIVLP